VSDFDAGRKAVLISKNESENITKDKAKNMNIEKKKEMLQGQ
jgi:hypothetical protein